MGARLYIEAPEIFYRDCDECKKYLHSERGIEKNSAGDLIERPESMPPRCDLCKKRDKDTGYIWEKFTPKNEYLFTVFRAAKAFGVLPRAGGIDNQIPEVLSTLLLLNDIFENAEDIRDKEFRIKLAQAGLRI